MDDKKLVKQLKKYNEKALVVLVERYSAYVSTVVRNIVSGVLGESDIEEITADVFIRLWNNADTLRAETLSRRTQFTATPTWTARYRSLTRSLSSSISPTRTNSASTRRLSITLTFTTEATASPRVTLCRYKSSIRA